MLDGSSGDASVICYHCGYTWRLVWIIAKALFRRLSLGCYECGPSNCPQCNPRLEAYWSLARAAAGPAFSRVAPINVPPDSPRAKAESPRPRP